jgi:hypothetical protein
MVLSFSNHNNNENHNNNYNTQPLFHGRIETVSGTIWSSIVDDYDTISNGKVVLVKWTFRKVTNRITFYTLEKRNDTLEKCIRVYRSDNFPVFWNYEACPTTPDEVDLETDDLEEETCCDICNVCTVSTEGQ